jgi:histidinol-phosphate aminotransferase
MPIPPRPEIAALTESVHGAADDAELERHGIDRREIIDFSVNVNPFGPSPRAVIAASQVAWDCYPDRNAVRLRQALGQRLGVAHECLMAGNGSGELLHLIALAYIRPGDDVLIIGPTYAEYARSSMAMGARCMLCHAVAETGFAVPAGMIVHRLRRLNPRVVYLCNPNNPTGQFLAPEVIDAWARQFDQSLFVVDEAFIDFDPRAPSMVGLRRSNVVVVRSLTKAYALAGLRLGYLVADPDVVRTLCRARVPWTVNASAQAAGVAAIGDDEHLRRTVTQLAQCKQELVTRLATLGLHPLPSAAPYFLVPVADAGRFRTMLLTKFHILVRDCTSLGLPGFIRIGTRGSADNTRLVEALFSSQSLDPSG